MNILMVAAENDALPGGKVGGIGDVVRDIPAALAAVGENLNVVSPGYGAFSKLPGAAFQTTISVPFAGQLETVEIYTVPAKSHGDQAPSKNVTLWVLEHPLFAAGGAGEIYCDDPSDRPFATDASKFSLFCAAVGKGIVSDCFGVVDKLHLHDWHASILAVLRAFSPDYKALQTIDTVYTIHNLALQGVRPLAGDQSSLESWFPELQYDKALINDPRAPHCINPMRAGINLSDKVHAVSPTYAKEICLPSNYQQGFFGGEGLEKDLQQAESEGRLHGILNGCEYPTKKNVPASTLEELLTLCDQELLKWISKTAQVSSSHLIASRRIAQRLSVASPTSASDKPFIVTSVGRITNQKVLLLQQILPDGQTALDHLLGVLADSGLFILLGSGDKELEQFLTEVAGRWDNFIFLRGYSEALSESIYRSGDFFLMPSSFEPCGISQMLAMRAAQPCLVHSVGGLNDTVIPGKNGFAFTGDTLLNQAQNMIKSFKAAMEVHQNKPKRWKTLSNAAGKVRFLWKDVAKDYQRLLYK
jgi:starch synthase